MEKGKGVPRDTRGAFKWYREAADQGLAMSQERLGAMYATGVGVEINHTEAYFWSMLAARQKERAAERRLAAMESRLSAEQARKVKASAIEWKPAFALK